MYRLFRVSLVVLLAGLALAGPASGASAAALVSPAGGVVGSGPGTCDENAFNSAISTSGAVVTFNCGGPATIVMTTPKVINVPITLDGGGIITLTGNLTTRFFTLGASSIMRLKNITLYQFNGGATNGGAIDNEGGELILDHAQLLQNQTDTNHSGGAIFTTGSVSIVASTLAGNSAGFGGAIAANDSQAVVSISDSTLSANQALNAVDGQGGALTLSDAYLTVNGGLISLNTSTGLGGAVFMNGVAAVVFQADSGPAQIFSNTTEEAGGAIFNVSGSLTLNGADLEYNRTLTTTPTLGVGGAIDDLGALVLTNSRLAHNQAHIGGGLNVKSGLVKATAAITHTLFYSNTASNAGGGLNTAALSSTVSIAASQFDANWAGTGGGLQRANAHLSILKSSFTRNVAQDGGGLYLLASPQPDSASYVEVQDTTISGNHTTGPDGGLFNGGLVDLHSVTLKDNSSGSYNAVGATLRLQSTVLDNGPNANCGGDPFGSGGSNYATDTTCALAGFNDTQGAGLQAGLGPLTSDPAVLTLFHLPQAGSPLLAHGGPGCAATDQRYAPRIGACDIGAIQRNGLLPRLFVPLVRR